MYVPFTLCAVIHVSFAPILFQLEMNSHALYTSVTLSHSLSLCLSVVSCQLLPLSLYFATTILSNAHNIFELQIIRCYFTARGHTENTYLQHNISREQSTHCFTSKIYHFSKSNHFAKATIGIVWPQKLKLSSRLLSDHTIYYGRFCTPDTKQINTYPFKLQNFQLRYAHHKIESKMQLTPASSS